MGYKLNDESWEVATPIAEKLAILPEGESLVLRDSREAIDRLRYVIYAWFYETGNKSFYKVIRRSPESLEIRKKALMRPTLVIDDKVEAYVTCNLLEIEDEHEATRRIRESVQLDELTSDEGIRALSEWSRIQGRPR